MIARVFLGAVNAWHTTRCLESRPSGRLLLVVFPDFTHEIAERFIDIDPLLGRSFDKLASKVFCEIAALVHANLTLVLEIALIGDHNDGERVLILHPEDLLVEGADFLEGVAGCDGVDEEEAFACAHVLFAHGPVFLLSRSVKHVEQRDLLINHALLAI